MGKNKSSIEINVFGGNVEILPNVTSAVQVFNEVVVTDGTKRNNIVARQILRKDLEGGEIVID